MHVQLDRYGRVERSHAYVCDMGHGTKMFAHRTAHKRAATNVRFVCSQLNQHTRAALKTSHLLQCIFLRSRVFRDTRVHGHPAIIY